MLNIMAGNYEALVPIFKGMGILDQKRDDLRRPGVEETFAAALERCMSGDDLGNELGEPTTDAKKVRYLKHSFTK